MTLAPAVIVPAERPAALAIARSLGRIGIPVYGVDADKHAIGMVSRYVTPYPLLDGDSSDENRLRALLDLGRRVGQRMVLFPVSDDAVLLCSKHRAELEPYYAFVMPDHETVTNLLTKDGMHALAEEHGVPAPQMFSVENAAQVEAIADRLPYPVIIKPVFSPSWLRPEINEMLRTGALGGAPKVAVCEDAAGLLETYRRIAEYDARMIVEEIIPGDDACLKYFCFYLDRDSRPLATFAGEKLRILPVGFGSASFVRSFYDPALEQISLDLLTQTGYRGLGGVEFKRDARDGSYKLIEFNVRFGMWDSLATPCGIDIPRIAYADALGEPVHTQREYQSGVHWVDMQRDIRAFLVYRARGELTLGEWLRSLNTRKYGAIHAADDWRPTAAAWREQSRVVWSALMRRLRTDD